MNHHQRRRRAKARPVRLPPRGSDDYTVFRGLVAQMPLVREVAQLEQCDVLETTDVMIELIGQGYLKLIVYPDRSYELVATEDDALCPVVASDTSGTCTINDSQEPTSQSPKVLSSHLLIYSFFRGRGWRGRLDSGK
jgi:hypothetical protein